MYCPGCATQTTDEINYCKQCGANLRGVRHALLSHEPEERFDWSKTWLAEMMMSEEEQRRRRAAIELSDRPEDLAAAELKRMNELKGGIITASVGIAVSIFLAFLLGAIADTVALRDPEGAVVLRHVWAAGIIPFMVGLALIANALFVSSRFSAKIRETLRASDATATGIPARATGELPALQAPPTPVASVTEHTTNFLPVDADTNPQSPPERRWARE
jgi:hypothetical protein